MATLRTPTCDGPPNLPSTVYEIALPSEWADRLQALSILADEDAGDLLARSVRAGLPLVEQQISAPVVKPLPFTRNGGAET